MCAETEREEVMTMETTTTGWVRGMQCYQNGPSPWQQDWQRAEAEAGMPTIWTMP
jgi:hypothetical protein